MKKVTVIILNYKVANLTIKCLESVQKSTYKNLDILIIDNNSQDGLEEKLQAVKGITFIQTGENLGFAGGCNVGIKKALKLGTDYVLLLNPDTTIDKDAIKILVEKSEQYNSGIANPKIYFAGGDTLWYAGKILDLANVLGNHRGVNEKDQGQYDKDEQMFDATGAAMLIKKEVVDKIGLFDERYFLYYEESDFAYRAINAGFKIMYIPEAVVYHKNAQSTGLGTPLQDYFITRNRMLFASKFLPFRTRLALLREAIKNSTIPARRLALIDFLTGKFGKGRFLK
jgi:GT2 family glycosyltransferase